MGKSYIDGQKPAIGVETISQDTFGARVGRRAAELFRILGGERSSGPTFFPRPVGGEVILQTRGIRKTFPGVVANDGIDLEVKAGEIHALLGENGAGKTTLVKILYGVYQPDEGDVLLGGDQVEINSPRDARDLGIGMVHQHFMLSEPHSVAENVALGLPGGSLIFPEEDVKDRIKEFSKVYGLKLNPDSKVWQLSAGEKQKIEIVKALMAGARMLILDEPTAVLTPLETDELFSALTQMAEQGRAIIFITHKLDEVLALAHEVTVLRKGRVVAKVKTSMTDRKKLANLMVGVDLKPSKRVKSSVTGEKVLEVSDLCITGDRGTEACQGISFTIKAGEILGLAGVAGNGQRELVEVLTGLRRAKSGKVSVLGRDITHSDPREIANIGVAYIPEDRLSIGIVPQMSVSENLVLRKFWREEFSSGLLLNEEKVRNFSGEMVEEFDIITPSIETPTRKLSGGNIQRLILARETSGGPRLIIASHPTSGLDVKAANDIRIRLARATDGGSSVLLDSEDLEEIFELSDRIAVMVEGRFVGVLPRKEATLEKIGLMMGGAVE